MSPPVHRRMMTLAGGLAALIGLTALVAWLLGRGDATALQSGWPTFKFDATVALTAAGAALALRARPETAARRLAIGAAMVTASLGGIALGALLVGVDSAILPPLLGLASPGMAPAAAFNFFFLAVALLLPESGEHSARWREGLSLTAATVALLVVLGFVMGVQTRHSVPAITSMALPAALAQLLLAAGLLVTPPAGPMMRLLTADGPAGWMMRRLFPLTIALPVGLSWLRLRGEQLGFYDREFGVSLMAVTIIVMLGAALAAAAYQLQRSEARLRSNETLFRGFFDNAPIGKVMTEPSGRLLRVNPALCRMLGYSQDELERVSWATITHPDDVAASRELVAGLLEGRGDVREIEKRYLRKDGRPVWTRVTTRLLRDDAGAPMRFLTHIVDIDERRKTDLELARSHAELQQFAYVASHDLQEPLRVMASYVQLLERRYRDKLDADGVEFVDYIVNASRRMQTLITDLLDFSRITTKAREPQPVDANVAVTRATENLGTAIAENGASVTSEPLPRVLADEGQLVQLFQNLIANAVKFRGDDPPCVRVTAVTEGGDVHFRVTDNGIGIAPEYGERIFIVFQRLHGPAQYPGTGIGLAICKKIVERHGGRIWVEPGAPGSVFHFTLPTAKVAA